MFYLTFNHDLNKFETFYAGLWSFSQGGIYLNFTGVLTVLSKTFQPWLV